MQNNQKSYPAKGWSTYPDGTSATAQSEGNIVPITDWVPGQEPAWAPIAGGKGFGKPERSNGPPGGGASGAGSGTGNATLAGGIWSNSTSPGMLSPCCKVCVYRGWSRMLTCVTVIAKVSQASAMSSQSSAPASSQASAASSQCSAPPAAKRDSQRIQMLAGKRTVNGFTHQRA